MPLPSQRLREAARRNRLEDQPSSGYNCEVPLATEQRRRRRLLDNGRPLGAVEADDHDDKLPMGQKFVILADFAERKAHRQAAALQRIAFGPN